eukprot:6645552-Alexandrium_andersonii.AAC.1
MQVSCSTLRGSDTFPASRTTSQTHFLRHVAPEPKPFPAALASVPRALAPGRAPALGERRVSAPFVIGGAQ